MVRLTATEAKLQYGDRLRVAALGALVKGTDSQGAPVIRVLHDGTRGVNVNTHIKVRDQAAGPLAADIKRVLRAQAEHTASFKGLIVDIEGAHRLIPVRREDWASKLVASMAILQST